MPIFDIDVKVTAESKSKVTEEVRTLLKSVKPELSVKVNKQSLNAIRQSVVNKFKDPIPIKIKIDQGSLNTAKQQIANLRNGVGGAISDDGGSSSNVIRGSTSKSGGFQKVTTGGATKEDIKIEQTFQDLLSTRAKRVKALQTAVQKGNKNAAQEIAKRLNLTNQQIIAEKQANAEYQKMFAKHSANLKDDLAISKARFNDQQAKQQAKEQAKLIKNQKKFLEQYNKLTDLQNNNKRLRKNTELNADVTQMRRQLLKSAYTKQSDDDLARTNEQYKVLQKNLAATGVAEQKLGTIVKNNASKFLKWYGVSQGVMHLQQGMTEMWEAVKNVDTAMTELRKVTDETNSTYTKFYDNATVRARNLGATVSDTINASADFARLGYNIDEAAMLADAATVYKNVGDGIEDIGTASSSIISTMKAFNIEAKDSMKIVDKYNEVGMKIA